MGVGCKVVRRAAAEAVHTVAEAAGRRAVGTVEVVPTGLAVSIAAAAFDLEAETVDTAIEVGVLEVVVVACCIPTDLVDMATMLHNLLAGYKATVEAPGSQAVVAWAVRVVVAHRDLAPDRDKDWAPGLQ